MTTETPGQLAKKYKRMVTAIVDGKPIGWGGVIGAAWFVANQPYHKKKISDVTFWGYAHEEQCLYHKKLLYSLTDATVEELLPSGDNPNIEGWSHEKKESLLTRVFGQDMPTKINNPVEVKFKTII